MLYAVRYRIVEIAQNRRRRRQSHDLFQAGTNHVTSLAGATGRSCAFLQIFKPFYSIIKPTLSTIQIKLNPLSSDLVQNIQNNLCLTSLAISFLEEKLFHWLSFAVNEVWKPHYQIYYSIDTLSQSIGFFEANEVSRPVTIRTNTLRTRRRNLAQSLVNPSQPGC